jgi:hypothetical protein
VIKFRAWDGEHMIHDIGIRSGMALHLDTGKMHDWPLMQYTGLNDKDGQEIYEGDICTAHYVASQAGQYRSSVVWNTGECAWNFAYAPLWTWEQMEVIGNIYQNPELLQQ